MGKKKTTNVKSKKKNQIPKVDDPAYSNRAVAQEDDEDEMDMDAEVDEVGFEKSEDDDDDDDF